MSKTETKKLNNGDDIEITFRDDMSVERINNKTRGYSFVPEMEAELFVYVNGEPYEFSGKTLIITHSNPICGWY